MVRQRWGNAGRRVRCTVLSQVAVATPEASAGKRLAAHLNIHVSPERTGDPTPG